MAPQYTIYVYTAGGILEAVCTDFLTVAVNRTVNAVDVAQFDVNAVSTTAPYIVYGAIVEVYRQDIDWHRLFQVHRLRPTSHRKANLVGDFRQYNNCKEPSPLTLGPPGYPKLCKLD